MLVEAYASITSVDLFTATQKADESLGLGQPGVVEPVAADGNAKALQEMSQLLKGIPQ